MKKLDQTTSIERTVDDEYKYFLDEKTTSTLASMMMELKREKVFQSADTGSSVVDVCVMRASVMLNVMSVCFVGFGIWISYFIRHHSRILISSLYL